MHPDRLVNLDIEKRFIGQRVFDALSQAFSKFEADEISRAPLQMP